MSYRDSNGDEDDDDDDDDDLATEHPRRYYHEYDACISFHMGWYSDNYSLVYNQKNPRGYW